MFERYKELEKELELTKSKLNKEFDNILEKLNIENESANKFEFLDRICLSMSVLYKVVPPFGVYLTCNINENENDEYYFNLLLLENKCHKIDKFYARKNEYDINVYTVAEKVFISNYLLYFQKFIEVSDKITKRIKMNNYFNKDLLVKDLMKEIENER